MLLEYQCVPRMHFLSRYENSIGDGRSFGPILDRITTKNDVKWSWLSFLLIMSFTPYCVKLLT